MQSPLASLTVSLKLQSSDNEKVTLHVSSAVLQRMPYFSVRLSDRWNSALHPPDQRCIDLDLPDGCTAEALAILFERLHFRRGALNGLNLSLALQVVQLAAMLLEQEDTFLDELKDLVLQAIRTSDDIEMFKSFCHRVEAPHCIADIAKSFERTEVVSMMSPAKQAELLAYGLTSGEDGAFEVFERLMAKLHRSGAEAICASAQLLSSLLGKGAAPRSGIRENDGYLTYVVTTYIGYNHRESYIEKPCKGLSNMLSMTSRFIFAYPEHFSALVVLMFPKIKMFPNCQSQEVEGVLKDQLKALLNLFFTGDLWEFSANDFEKFLGKLSSNGNLACLTDGSNSATGEAPDVGSVLEAFHKFIQRAPASVKIEACKMMQSAGASVVKKIITADFVNTLPALTGQSLCMILLPHLGELPERTKIKVLQEARSGINSNGADEPFQLQPKRRRV